MARANHKQVRRMLNREKNVTDKQFFVSRAVAGHFADIAAAQSKRYGYNRGINVRIVWEPKNEMLACTNNSVILINAANKLVKSKADLKERYEIVGGLFAHELGHVLYTDFLCQQTYTSTLLADGWYPARPACASLTHRLNVDEMEAYRKQGPDQQNAFVYLAKNIENMIEDGYIEEKVLEHFPGVIGKNLEIMRGAFWDQIRPVSELIDDEEDDRYKCATIFSMILSYCLYGEIKYGSTPLSDERIQAVFKSLDVLDEGLNTTDARVRWQTVNTLMAQNWSYIRPYMELCEEKSRATGKSIEEVLRELLGALAGATAVGSGTTGAVPEAAQAGTGRSPGKGRRAATAALAQASSPEKDKEEEEEPEKANGGSDSSEDEDDELDGPVMSGISSTKPQKVETKEGGRIPLQQTDTVSVPSHGGIEYDDEYAGAGYDAAARDVEMLLERIAEERLETKRTSQFNELAQNISYGNIHEGVRMHIHRISHVDGRLRDMYDEVAPPLLHISKQLQRSITRQLQDKRRGGKLTGQYMGRRLDIHALPRNDGRAFYKTALPNETPELAVALLLDESGSMAGAQRATYARATAIILYDFCQSLGIPVMVYGHSTGSGVDLYSYAEFEAIDKQDRYRMMDISARGSNRDGAALRYVAERLVKRPEDVKLLILVSDGQPADSGYYGTAAEEDLRGIKQEYRRKGICFVAAAIGNDRESIERIYGDSFMDITDLNKLPVILTNVVKRFIRV